MVAEYMADGNKFKVFKGTNNSMEHQRVHVLIIAMIERQSNRPQHHIRHHEKTRT
jgi:hypothetical protein